MSHFKTTLPCILAVLTSLSEAMGAEPVDLNSLLKLYRDYGMPVPATGARLVGYSHPGVSIVNGVEQRPRQHLAFLAKEEGKSVLLLVGPIVKRMGKNEINWKFVLPSEIETHKVEMESFGLCVFEVNARLATALQLQALGERRAAAAFFEG